MVDVSGLMQRLCNSEDDDIGMVNHVEDHRWIVGDHDLSLFMSKNWSTGRGCFSTRLFCVRRQNLSICL